MKKTLALVLALLMMLGCLAACASDAKPSTSEQTTTETTKPAETMKPAEETKPAETTKPAEETKPTEETKPAEETKTGNKPNDPSIFPLCEPGAITLHWMRGDVADTPLKLMEPDFSQNWFYNYLEELTGIDIEWEIIQGTTFTEQFKLMLVSEDYPDICNNTLTNVSGSPDQAYEDEVLIRLNDYEGLWPNYRNMLDQSTSGYAGSLTMGGNLLGFWQLRDRAQPPFLGYYARGDWMDELGLELPDTIDEFEEMLIAFRDSGKTSGRGVMGWPSTGVAQSNWICRSWGVNMQAPYMIQRDGVVSCSVIEDGYREFLAKFQEWFAGKLIYQDFAGVDPRDYTAAYKLIDSLDTCVYVDMYRNAGTYVHDVLGFCDDSFYAVKLHHPTMEKGTPNPIGDKGPIKNAGSGMMGAMIFTSCEHIEEAIQMIDWIYSDEGTLKSNWGWEGKSFEYDENGKPRYLASFKDPDQATARELYLIQSRPHMDLMDALEDGQGEDALDYYTVWSDYGEWNMPYVSYTAEEGEEQSRIQNDVSTYVSEFTLKVMCNQIELTDENWNNYVNGLKGMGIDRLVELAQIALDRMLALG